MKGPVELELNNMFVWSNINCKPMLPTLVHNFLPFIWKKLVEGEYSYPVLVLLTARDGLNEEQRYCAQHGEDDERQAARKAARCQPGGHICRELNGGQQEVVQEGASVEARHVEGQSKVAHARRKPANTKRTRLKSLKTCELWGCSVGKSQNVKLMNSWS